MQEFLSQGDRSQDFILEVEKVAYGYPDGTLALQNINLQVPAGAKIALLGPNGAGKSTLFLHLIGLLQPKQGCIRFRGMPIKYHKSALKELRQQVGIVFQDPENQLFSANVWQEVSFGPMNLGWREQQVRQRVQQAMELTDIVDLQDRPVHALSYGQKKRVAIAGVLAMDPQVLIVDEPTVWLDQEHAGQIMEIFNRLNTSEGKTVILSTHDVDLAYSWADYIYVLKGGQVIGQGTAQEIFSDVDLVERAALALPWLVQMYQELRDKGWIANATPLPTTREKLFQLIPVKA